MNKRNASLELTNIIYKYPVTNIKLVVELSIFFCTIQLDIYIFKTF